MGKYDNLQLTNKQIWFDDDDEEAINWIVL